MPELIQSIFIDPPIGIARVGGSTSPQDAYDWVQSLDPRADGETSVAPAWSLDVMADGSIQPRMPTAVTFRDDAALIRPVCPFFEVWALVGESGSAPETWRETPLTTALLAQHGTDESALTIRVNAQNCKRLGARETPITGSEPVPRSRSAAMTTRKGSLRYQPGGRAASHDTCGTQHPARLGTGLAHPAEPAGRGVQRKVDLEVIRLRFTPGRGRFFGPPRRRRRPRSNRFPP